MSIMTSKDLALSHQPSKIQRFSITEENQEILTFRNLETVNHFHICLMR